MPGLDAQLQTVAKLQPMRLVGRVRTLRGLTLLVQDLPMPVGSLVRVETGATATTLGEIIGFDGPDSIVMMLGSTAGIRGGDRVVGLHATQTVGVGSSLLGRVINGLGHPIDGRGPIHDTAPRPIDPDPIGPLARRSIDEPMHTGVRAIDLFTTLGRGQRMGVFAGPGVGKSTLLGAIARGCASDVSVIALIGERGREVRDFIEHNLGPEGLARSVVVVATSDESALLRTRAALVACAVAEHFRDRGKAVMLIMDSVTRFAHAQRQIGLSVGEPPATRGYTPSVFAAMARLLERAGATLPLPEGGGREVGSDGRTASATIGGTVESRNPPPNPLPLGGGGAGGSITGLYAVLVEGDEMTEPVADAARGILDGHLILSRSLAQRAHYPAIDVLDSVSRVADDVTDEAHRAARRQLVRLLAAYKQVEDLVQIGAYAKGSSPQSDVAIRYHDQIVDVLQQDLRQPDRFDDARSRMVKLAIESGAALQQASGAAQRRN